MVQQPRNTVCFRVIGPNRDLRPEQSDAKEVLGTRLVRRLRAITGSTVWGCLIGAGFIAKVAIG